MLTKKEIQERFTRQYKKYYEVELFQREGFIRKKGPVFILIKVETGNLEDIARVSHTPQEIRDRLKKSLI